MQRREERLAAIRDAKEKIEERAQERHAVERAEYEEKLKRRQEREAATGKKVGGKPPEPEAGPKDKDQVNFHGSCRARKGTSYRATTQSGGGEEVT